ncbi:hypothetical protein T492DRAFT_905159 [Pavlovales sp. CCMP2436]|nr:hypothetical protein T492DRAFT_905159 [Pavlovales sp. CCMP2436]
MPAATDLVEWYSCSLLESRNTAAAAVLASPSAKPLFATGAGKAASGYIYLTLEAVRFEGRSELPVSRRTLPFERIWRVQAVADPRGRLGGGLGNAVAIDVLDEDPDPALLPATPEAAPTAESTAASPGSPRCTRFTLCNLMLRKVFLAQLEEARAAVEVHPACTALALVGDPGLDEAGQPRSSAVYV